MVCRKYNGKSTFVLLPVAVSLTLAWRQVSRHSPRGRRSHGPQVTLDPLARPIPAIPLPNDLMLVGGADTASGLQWNSSVERVSEHQRHLRQLLNQLDGFGTFAPAMVAFEGEVDLTTVTEDSVILIGIQGGTPIGSVSPGPW